MLWSSSHGRIYEWLYAFAVLQTNYPRWQATSNGGNTKKMLKIGKESF